MLPELDGYFWVEEGFAELSSAWSRQSALWGPGTVLGRGWSVCEAAGPIQRDAREFDIEVQTKF